LMPRQRALDEPISTGVSWEGGAAPEVVWVG
jgi:hypothetical protein